MLASLIGFALQFPMQFLQSISQPHRASHPHRYSHLHRPLLHILISYLRLPHLFLLLNSLLLLLDQLPHHPYPIAFQIPPHSYHLRIPFLVSDSYLLIPFLPLGIYLYFWLLISPVRWTLVSSFIFIHLCWNQLSQIALDIIIYLTIGVSSTSHIVYNPVDLLQFQFLK